MENLVGQKLTEMISVATLSGAALATGLPILSDIQTQSKEQFLNYQQASIQHSLATLKAGRSINSYEISNCTQLWNHTLDGTVLDWRNQWSASENQGICNLQLKQAPEFEINVVLADFQA